MPKESSTSPGSRERACVIALVAGHAILRAVAAFTHQVNSDEPQHLHVAWAWTQGLLQYRDVLDNHAPLFHALSAPLLSLLGESASIVTWMRLAMIPLVAASMLFVYAIAKRLFGARIALWSAGACWLWPSFVTASVEYRADVLWMCLWSCVLWVLFTRPWTRGSSFAAGILLGATFATSMKTSLLAVALVAGVLVAATAAGRLVQLAPARSILARVACTLAGSLVVPAVVVAWFAAHGGLDALVEGVVRHNLGAKPPPDSDRLLRAALFAVAVALVWLEVRRTIRAGHALSFQRAAFFASTALYVAALYAFWPLVTRQDLLPVHLPIAVLVTAWIVEFVEHRPAIARGAYSTAIAALVLVLSWRLYDVVEKNTRGAGPQREFLADVLKFTRPGDPVFDLKGECVFRPRGYFPVLEKITRDRLARGEMPDDCAADLASARVVLSILDDPAIPRSGRPFLDAHFVPAGRVRVLGHVLDLAPEGYAEPRRFHVAFPARFVLVGENGPPLGKIDGRRADDEGHGVFELGAGEHAYTPLGLEGRIAVVWQSAVERGWSFADVPPLEGACR